MKFNEELTQAGVLIAAEGFRADPLVELSCSGR